MQGEKRLFTAIELPDSWHYAISNTQAAFKNRGVQGNYIPVESLHLTINFIGETSLEARIIDQMSRLSFPMRIDVSAAEGGLFPRRRGGDLIVWHIFCDRDFRLYQKAESEAFAGLGIPMERRPYTPHLTLVRRARGSFLKSPEFPFVFAKPEPFSVSEILLLRSELVDGKRVYTPVHRHILNQNT
ncbi:MAG TPA: RNA 2',3'-cyclic phosphodiesterase [Clostridia bacterium]|nr:RNA 2',3'-cyclic phosphodiesterase [Clostridia bacterium]